MRVLVIAAQVAIASTAPGREEWEELQKWRPALGRDLSTYTGRMPEHTAPVKKQWPSKVASTEKAFEFKKGWKSAGNPECGLENPNGVADRIVGGHVAAEHQWPWQVALFVDDGAWFCGGSLISDEWVMTAAHCVHGAFYFDIMAGAHNVRLSSEPHRVEITSFEGQVHPGWDSANARRNDIALIHLPEKITFSEYIRPSCLPPASDADNDYEGVLTTPVGWGKVLDSAGSITPLLHMVSDLAVISSSACAEYYGDLIDSGITCIDSSGGKGICIGDSGSTLNVRQEAENKWTQVGVASFVAPSGCQSGDPQGFSRVAEHLQWIETVTGLSLV